MDKILTKRKMNNNKIKKAGFIMPVIALTLFLAGNFLAKKEYHSSFPPITELQPTAFTAPLDMAALSLGSRRVFADIWLIRLLIYYGLESNGEGKADSADEFYKEFTDRAFHIARLDPSFRSANTLTAAILAFNMNRYDDAEALLKYLLKYHPEQRFYTQSLLSVAARKKGDPSAMLESIIPVIRAPDCPPLIKNITALLFRRAGRYAEAAELYADIIRTSKEKEYIDKAVQGLKDLELVRQGYTDPLSEELQNI